MGAEMSAQLKRQSILNNERGTALLETIPLLVVFVVLTATGLGLFGVVHTGVLHSIAARTYSFETFRNRTNLYYFREDGSGLSAGTALNYSKKGWRYHAIQNESDPRNRFVATVRPVSFGRALAASESGQEVHNSTIFSITGRNERLSVNPAWIMVGYGICLNAGCGN
jgi:hypothetical protein